MVAIKENKFNFTKAGIEKLITPEGKANICVYDTKESGLMIMCLASGIKTFYLYRKIGNKPERIKIGRFPDLSIENARIEAGVLKGRIAKGENPNEEKKKLSNIITFEELFQLYMERHSKKNKKTWKYDEEAINRLCKHLFKMKLKDINVDKMRQLQEDVTENKGIYMANRLFNTLKGMFNKAIDWGCAISNPCSQIKNHKEKSRERFLQPLEIEKLKEILSTYQNQIIKDYIYISLLTGARKGDILEMRFEEINWDLKQWEIPEIKNGYPHTIPLIELAFEILTKRKQDVSSIWVFPSKMSKTGHLVEPKRAWKTILTKAGIKDVRLHDLRRTLGSLLAGSGANSYIISKTLGHKSSKATDVYARLNLDPVREAMEKATSIIK